MMQSSWVLIGIVCCSIVWAPPPLVDHYQGLLDHVESTEDAYNARVGGYGAPSGYSQKEIKCRDEERVQFVDKCVPYESETCYTQVEENCQMEMFPNCTGIIETKAERKCFDVKELVCGLVEKVDYFTVQEDYLVQVCSTVKERVCDTTFQIDANTRDDFQCTNLEFEQCEDAESVLRDVTCKKTIEFQCRKEKRPFEEGYGKKTICEKVPKENCYDTPRTVSIGGCNYVNDIFVFRFVRNCVVPQHSVIVRNSPTLSRKLWRSRIVTLSPRKSASCRRGADPGKPRGSATLRIAIQFPGRSVILSGPRNSSLTASRWSDPGVTILQRKRAQLNN